MVLARPERAAPAAGVAGAASASRELRRRGDSTVGGAYSGEVGASKSAMSCDGFHRSESFTSSGIRPNFRKKNQLI